MTAETLKPFITTTSAENFLAADHHQHHHGKKNSSNNRQKNNNILPIALGVVGIVLGISLLGFTVWMTLRFNKLEYEVKSMQKRLGLNYLDDLNEFDREYGNALLENSNAYDDEDMDIDSKENVKINSVKINSKYKDEEYDDYNDRLDVLAKQYQANVDKDQDDDDDDDSDLDLDEDEEEDENNSEKTINDKNDENKNDENVSDDDNLYDDFGKYQDSKKHRKIRSVHDLVSDQTSEPNRSQVKHRHRSTLGRRQQNFVSNRNPNYPIYPYLHKMNHRSRKSRVIKSDDSLISVKSMPTINRDNSISAAHFHINRKIPHRHSPLKIDSYNGDIYIGSPVWSNDASHFEVESGILRTREPGLYYIYAQICYNNTYDHNGFIIFHDHKPFLQCLNTVPTHLTFKIHTCHTSGLIYLLANETIHLRDIHSDRDVVLKETNNRSFFGFMKIK